MEIQSTAFHTGGTIPREYTCDGKDQSPPLAWSGAPPGTASYALICDDPDAPVGIWDHWLLWNIAGQSQGLPAGLRTDASLPDGSRQGKNGWGEDGYRGPCPPRGKPHRYFFRLYALDSMLDLPGGATKGQLKNALKGHVLAQAELIGVYSRG